MLHLLQERLDAAPLMLERLSNGRLMLTAVGFLSQRLSDASQCMRGTKTNVERTAAGSGTIIDGREGETEFLNVDLDILSASPLESLVSAFGKKVAVLYVGGERRRYKASLELASFSRTADATIRRLAKLIEALPKPARRIWDQAHSRVFNIGIRGGHQPVSREWLVGMAAVAAVARVRGSIMITVYAAEAPASARTHA